MRVLSRHPWGLILRRHALSSLFLFLLLCGAANFVGKPQCHLKVTRTQFKILSSIIFRLLSEIKISETSFHYQQLYYFIFALLHLTKRFMSFLLLYKGEGSLGTD